MDKRKAMIGYAVYTAGKPVVRRALKARARRMEGKMAHGKRHVPKKAMIAAAGAAVGAMAIWRRRHRSKADQALES
jgi:hypothetical protein